MNAVDTAALRALAEAATPGPWTWREEHGRDYTDEGWSYIPVVAPAGWVLCDLAGCDDDNAQDDAAFIAAANPTALLALLDEVDRLRAAVARVEALAEKVRAVLDDPYCEASTWTISHLHRALEGQ